MHTQDVCGCKIGHNQTRDKDTLAFGLIWKDFDCKWDDIALFSEENTFYVKEKENIFYVKLKLEFI